MILFASPRFAEHMTPPGHPERSERAEVFQAIAASWVSAGHVVRSAEPATRAELLRVHTSLHIDAIAATAGRAVMIDADTFTSPESAEIALLAAGSAVAAARETVRAGEPSLALVRPPGHHALADRAMGFCLFNNAAVAAAALRADGVQRVAVIDIAVHHGNGPQAIFYRDPSVLYVSTHQFPFYPGTGTADERGEGPGYGATVNVPLAAGAGDDAFRLAYRTAVLPALDAFSPDAMIVSAGFDAHVRDPLGGLRVSTEGFRDIMRDLDQASQRLCGRRCAWITEGGYDLEALDECLRAAMSVLM